MLCFLRQLFCFDQVETDSSALNWKVEFRNPLSNHVLEFQLGTEFLEPQAFSPEPWKVGSHIPKRNTQYRIQS
jgi:hypothetical protein